MIAVRFSLASLLAFFFFNDTATTEIYTLSLHDALPISCAFKGTPLSDVCERLRAAVGVHLAASASVADEKVRSEEHTSELQSLAYLVCRLLLEKKKNSSASAARARSAVHEPSSPLAETH